MNHETFVRRARRLEWLLFDVDGVLTDGSLFYSRRGEELKRFNVRDGLAFRLAQRAGLRLGLLSGRRSRALEKRATELDFDEMMLGSKDKVRDFQTFLEKYDTTPGQVAFMGDDLPDLPVLGRCALSFAPRDAAPEVCTLVHEVVDVDGGHGAARQMIESILKARGEWENMMSFYSLEMPAADSDL